MRAEDDDRVAPASVDHEIVSRLRKRDQLRGQRKFDMADRLREDLQRRGIEMNDRRKVFWIKDTSPFADPALIAKAKDKATDDAPSASKNWKSKDGQGALREAGYDVSVVGLMLDERDRARAEKDFDRADAIYSDLRDGLKLILDDNARVWAVDWEALGLQMGPSSDPEPDPVVVPEPADASSLTDDMLMRW